MTEEVLAALKEAILNEQDGDRDLAVGCIDFPAFGEKAHDQSRARHGHEQAEDDGGAGRNTQQRGARCHQARSEDDLEPTRRQRRPPEAPEPVHWKLERDLEEQEDHAELRQQLDQILSVDLPALERNLEAAGVPWTPGRSVPGN